MAPALTWPRLIHGVGPAPCRLLFLGEAPGPTEERIGEPFVGVSGRLLNELLWRCVGLNREDIYLTNAYKCHPPDNRDPTTAELAEHAPLLEAELAQVQPEIVVCLGAVAARRFVPGAVLESMHGCAVRVGQYAVHICYHPAAGLHNSERLADFADDLRRLRRLLDGDPSIWLPEDAYPEARYHLLLRRLPDAWADVVAVDTEGSQERPWGLSYSVRPGEGYVIQASATVALRAFRDRLEATQPLVVLHSALHDLGVLRAMGIEGFRFTDTMELAYLLQRDPQGLKALAARRAGMAMSDYLDIVSPAQDRLTTEALWNLLDAAPVRWMPTRLKTRVRWDRKTTPLIRALGRCLQSKEPHRLWSKQQPPIHAAARKLSLPLPREVTLDDVPLHISVPYSGADADGTGRIYPRLQQEVIEEGLADVLEADLAIYPMVERMHQVGIQCDRAYFERLGPWFMAEREQRIAELARLTGVQLNPNSGDQVAELLFGTLGLPAPRRRKGKGRPSTDKKVLGALEALHPAVKLIIEARQCTKLKTAYVDRLLPALDAHDRLHPNFRLTRVVTGRLAAHSPNVLAMPKHSTLAKKIREGFVAPPGRLIASWDLSGIELRWLAIISKDPALIAAFCAGRDLHAEVAQRIFGVRPEQQDGSKHRLPSKSVSFGVCMGITEKGLMEQLHKAGQTQWTESACRDLLNSYFEAYPGILRYIHARHAEARQYGYVRDYWGRKRYLPGIYSPQDEIREAAEREAQAIPIQAGAQGLVKRWMARVWQEVCQAAPGYVEPWLQIHDDLVLELEEGLWDWADPRMHVAIPQGFDVPILAEGKRGQRWSEVS